ncbi:MAG: long-chain-fatty-acid--CoA ligase [Wolinella sp.]
MDNIYSFLSSSAHKYPFKTALFVDDKKISFRDLLKESDRIASFLTKEGIGKGDCVAVIMANSWEYVATIFGVFRTGAILVPINTMLKSDEMQYVIKDSGASLAFVSGKFFKETQWLLYTAGLKKIVWHDADILYDEQNISYSSIPYNGILDTEWASGDENIAAIIYTSGTTGFPKGAMLTHNNFISNLQAVSTHIKVRQNDRFIVYLPMFHVFTLTTTILLPMYSACTLVIIKQLMPFSNILKQVLLKRVSIFIGVPDVYNALIRAKLPWYFMWFNSIRIFVSGASALSDTILQRYKEKFKRAVMIEGYGLSECSPIVAVNKLEKQCASSVGTPLPGYEVKIVNKELIEVPRGEKGEIIVKGGCVMKGYLNHEEATQNTIINGWLLTGYIGYMDEDGFIYISDRKKDLIISKGINIYPREIEEVILNGFSQIKACAVVGYRDEILDETPVAFVEYDNEDDAAMHNEIEIKNYLKRHLANFKIPKYIYERHELPKNATGKVLKRVLRDELQERGLS